MKALLAPVAALGVRVLGTISDAQESELLAVEELWPDVPHQVCQFHVLRDASKWPSRPTSSSKRRCANASNPRSERCANRESKHLVAASSHEANQLTVLDDYASGIVTALNPAGLQPFKYATVEASQMLDDIEASLRQLAEKKGL